MDVRPLKSDPQPFWNEYTLTVWKNKSVLDFHFS